MKSAAIRKKLGMSRSAWAHTLGVNERTVVRWEDEGAEPGGLALAVMAGISNAIEVAPDLARVRRMVGLGITYVVGYGLGYPQEPK